MRSNYIIGIIGAGNMGEALIRGLINSQLVRPYEILASRRNKTRRNHLERNYGIHCTASNKEVVNQCPTIILAVKPQNMRSVLKEIAPAIDDRHLLISIAAGIDTKMLKDVLGASAHIARAMPNLPAIIDAGVTAIYCCRGMPERYKRFVHQIFQAVGTTIDVSREHVMDVITAISGTGPAYFFALMEAMRDTAIALGLPATAADSIVKATASGACGLAATSKQSAEELRDQVTSKRGTTWAAMKVFKKRRFWKTVSDAIYAAAKRAEQLRRI